MRALAAALLVLLLPLGARADDDDLDIVAAAGRQAASAEDAHDALSAEELNARGLAVAGGFPRSEEDYKAQAYWFKKAAARGHAGAMYRLGELYHYGRGGLPEDETIATGYRLQAADLGLPLAQREIGVHYAYEASEANKNKYPPPNYAKAREWLTRAADGGDLEALSWLAYYMREGRFGSPDLAKAHAWDLQAARGGLVPSCTQVGVDYETGRGVEKDLVEAYRWYLLGKRGYDDTAKEPVARLKALLSAEQLAKAEALAGPAQR